MQRSVFCAHLERQPISEPELRSPLPQLRALSERRVWTTGSWICFFPAPDYHHHHHIIPWDGNLVPPAILLSGNYMILLGTPETQLDSILGVICILMTRRK